MAGEELPPVPALRAPVDADAFAKLEAVAARAAHEAAERSSLSGWALAEFVEAHVRAELRRFVTPAPDPYAPEMPAPAERPASRVFGVVKDAMRAAVGLDDRSYAELTQAVLRALARAGMLTPGDVVVRDARAAGLGVLVDGRPVEPERVHLVRPADAERRDPGAGVDLVSRMIDARAALAGGDVLAEASIACEEAVVEARRALDEGIEEGMAQRELYGRLRQLVVGEEHLCTCHGHGLDDVAEPGGCCGLDGGDRCRFERALRSLLGVEASA